MVHPPNKTQLTQSEITTRQGPYVIYYGRNTPDGYQTKPYDLRGPILAYHRVSRAETLRQRDLDATVKFRWHAADIGSIAAAPWPILFNRIVQICRVLFRRCILGLIP